MLEAQNHQQRALLLEHVSEYLILSFKEQRGNIRSLLHDAELDRSALKLGRECNSIEACIHFNILE